MRGKERVRGHREGRIQVIKSRAKHNERALQRTKGRTGDGGSIFLGRETADSSWEKRRGPKFGHGASSRRKKKPDMPDRKVLASRHNVQYYAHRTAKEGPRRPIAAEEEKNQKLVPDIHCWCKTSLAYGPNKRSSGSSAALKVNTARKGK